MIKNWYLCLLCVPLFSCATLRNTPKNTIKDGFFIQKTAGEKHSVFVDVDNDLLAVYPTKINNNTRIADTFIIPKKYPTSKNEVERKVTSFTKSSFDIDFLTIPFKYRFAAGNVPPQLNTNLNGAVFVGFRNDSYKLSYISNPVGGADRMLNHYGFSFGLFNGFGNTAINFTTTSNVQLQEYDGLVWTKGIAQIIAINNFTVGLALGFDNLLNNDHKYWIYETKPWVGLAFGLNLN